MNIETQQIIEEQLEKLPDTVRQAIANIDFPGQLRALSQKYNLRVDQAGAVENEIMLVLLGLEHPDAFIQNLARVGGLSKETATSITSDINESVFKAIRHELAELHERERLTEELARALEEEASIPEAARVAGQQVPAAPQAGPVLPPQNKPGAPVPSTQSTQTTTPQSPSGLERTFHGDAARVKLEQSFRIPPDKVTLSPNAAPRYSGTDPYREPVA